MPAYLRVGAGLLRPDRRDAPRQAQRAQGADEIAAAQAARGRLRNVVQGPFPDAVADGGSSGGRALAAAQPIISSMARTAVA